MFLFALNKDKVFRGFLTCPLEGYRSATEIKGLLNAQGREEMESMESQVQTEKYAKCVEGSKRIRWDIDKDVFRGREFDFSKKFLPDGISKLDQLKFIAAYSGDIGHLIRRKPAICSGSFRPVVPGDSGPPVGAERRWGGDIFDRKIKPSQALISFSWNLLSD